MWPGSARPACSGRTRSRSARTETPAWPPRIHPRPHPIRVRAAPMQVTKSSSLEPRPWPPPTSGVAPTAMARNSLLAFGRGAGGEEGGSGVLSGSEALLGEPSAVDRERDPVHVGGLVAREVQRSVGDVGRHPGPPLWDD